MKTAAEMMDEFGSPSGVLMNAISVLVDEIDWKENQTEKEKYLLEAWEEYHRRVKFPCPTCGIGEKRARTAECIERLEGGRGMKIFVVIATEMYERGYDIVGARHSREAAEALVKAAEEGRFPPTVWASEEAREYYTTRDAKRMDYEIQEVVAE